LPQKVSSNSIGTPFIELQTVDSSNKYAMGLVHEACLPDRQGMAKHGTVVYAHNQQQGRGQRGKSWSSEPGANIVLSVIIKPERLLLSEQFSLSACVAVAVHKFFTKYAGDQTKIKWPNDLYWRDRKAGGILIESVVGSSEFKVQSSETAVHSPQSTVAGHQLSVNDWKWAVAGMGININQTVFPDDLPNPVSLKQITGKSFDSVELAKELCGFIDRQYDLLLHGKSKEIFELYNQYLYKRNEKVKLKKNNRVFEVTIKGVSQKGKLMVSQAIDEEFDFGEVEWVI
jgi:BirA family biotin operon repressor/biotin-[acetyl-CoA-carboxylase] ligase